MLAVRFWQEANGVRCGKGRLEKSGAVGRGVAGHVKGKGGRGGKRAWRSIRREKGDVCD